jgi:hypothetical protein
MTFEKVVDTKELQIESVIRFAKALGYRVYHKSYTGFSFAKEGWERYGGYETISPNTMIRLHNGYDVGPFTASHYRPQDTIRKYLEKLPIECTPTQYGLAEAAKLIVTAKIQYSKKKKDFVVQSHKIRFNNLFAKTEFEHLFEEEYDPSKVSVYADGKEIIVGDYERLWEGEVYSTGHYYEQRCKVCGKITRTVTAKK